MLSKPPSSNPPTYLKIFHVLTPLKKKLPKYFDIQIHAYIKKKQILVSYLNWHPFFVTEGGPNVMGLCDGGLVRFEDNFGSVCIHVQGSQNED